MSSISMISAWGDAGGVIVRCLKMDEDRDRWKHVKILLHCASPFEFMMNLLFVFFSIYFFANVQVLVLIS